jgi:hypothetical protein
MKITHLLDINNILVMDSTSIGVLTTLGFDILGAGLIFFGWLIIRSKRGDQSKVNEASGYLKEERLTRTNLLFKETDLEGARRATSSGLLP